jgi:hypothetical protein
MSRVVDIPSESVTPSGRAVLTGLGIPEARDPEPRVQTAVDDALEVLTGDAEPRGILGGVGVADFGRIYEGEGRNEEPSPLAEIFPRADALVLFATTLGAPVSDRITGLFDSKDLTLAVTLDAAASIAVELAGDHLESLVLEETRSGTPEGDEGQCADASSAALRYSPGYCGWDLTGQRALFGRLKPERIGIRLLESCLMDPLKSLSGVIVLGRPEIHMFDNHYSFCSECRSRSCRERIAGLRP